MFVTVGVVVVIPPFPSSSPLFANCRHRHASLLLMMMDDGPDISNDDTTTSSFPIVLLYSSSLSRSPISSYSLTITPFTATTRCCRC
mmetsp:Transcript_54090/g.62480  ORF Transcript_54090/g.62480 Transcript_54090/m.62480 type:complete len:87 (-) Transcript_54090:44-304(-)